MLKVDFHTHTADDPHDRLIPYTTRELIDRAATLGYDALAITLHDSQLDVRPHAGYARERGVVLIPGMERTVEGRHVLLLNFDRGAEDVQTFDDLRRLKERSAGLVIAPHPFFPGPSLFGKLTEHADLFDAVEYNAMFTSSLNLNRFAQQWARRHGKPMVGNGDVHLFEQLGSTYSLVDAEPDPSAICAAVVAGRVTPVTNPLSWATAIRVMSSLVKDMVVADRRLPELPSMGQPCRSRLQRSL